MNETVDDWEPYDEFSVERLNYMRDKCYYIKKENEHLRKMLIECRTTISVLRNAARCHNKDERAEHANIMLEVDVLLDQLKCFTRGR